MLTAALVMASALAAIPETPATGQGLTAPPTDVGEIAVSEDGGVERGDELVDRRTEFSKTFETNLPGVFEVEMTEAPLHFEGGDGEWHTFDSDLEPATAGTVEPGATDVPLEIATDGSAEALVAVQPTEGVSIGFGIEGAESVEAVIEGETAAFKDVVEGADIELAAMNRGVKEEIVLESPASPSQYRFPLALDGATATLTASGSVEYRDGSNTVVATTPPGFMMDSAVTTGVGERSLAVEYSLEQDSGGQTLVVTVDQAWLDDPARVYPVVIDPSISLVADSQDTVVAANVSGDHSSGTSLYIGNDGTYGPFRSYLDFPTLTASSGGYQGMNIYDATLNLHQFFGASCVGGKVEAYAVDTAWTGSTVTYPGPISDPPPQSSLIATDAANGTSGFGATGCTSPGTLSIHITPAVDRWVSMDEDYAWANYGIMLKAANETTNTGVRGFNSANAATDKPTLTLLYSDPSYDEANAPSIEDPILPEPGDRFTQSITVSGTYSDPNGDDGYVIVWTYTPDSYNFAANLTTVVHSGEIAGLTGSLIWDAPFAFRMSAVDDDTPGSGTRSSRLTPFIHVQPRSVQITDLEEDQVLFGDATITAVPQVTTNLTGVEFVLDGNAVGTDTTSPYESTGSTTAIPGGDGAHTIAARAIYSTGPPRTSPLVDFYVNNSMSTRDRLLVDYAAGAITVDELVLMSVEGRFDQATVPSRYQSEVGLTNDPLPEVMGYAEHWDEISPTTEAEIQEFLSLKVSDTLNHDIPIEYQLKYEGCDGSRAVSASPFATITDPRDQDWCTADQVVDEDTGQGVRVLFRVEPFDEVHGVEDVDEDENGVPDTIDQVLTGTAAAMFDYLDAGFTLPEEDRNGLLPVLVGNLEGLAPWNVVPFPTPRGWTPPDIFTGDNHYVGVSPNATRALARHEMFHVFQYQYMDRNEWCYLVIDCGADGGAGRWWMEASAEWAAGYSERQSPVPNTTDDFSVGNLPEFLGNPDRGVQQLSLTDDRAYGGSIFIDYLEAQFGVPEILAVFERMGETDDVGPIGALASMFNENETSWAEVTPRFWRAAYLLGTDFSNNDLNFVVPPEMESDWRTVLDAAVETEADAFGLARPQRSLVTASIGMPPEAADLVVHRLGSRFVDIDTDLNASPTGHGMLRVNVESSERSNSVHIAALKYSSTGYPELCTSQPVVHVSMSNGLFSGSAGEVLIPIGGRCRDVTLVLTGTDREVASMTTGFHYSIEFESSPGTERVSVDSAEAEGDDISDQAALSSDDDFVAFTSSATNLIDDPVGSGREVYLRDLEAGVTTLVSGGDDDVDTDESGHADVAESGEYVAFASLDEDLDDTEIGSDGAQVYVRETDTGDLTRVSRFVPLSGDQIQSATHPSISNDGNLIAYEGGAFAGLDRTGSPTEDVSGVYLYDVEEDETTVIANSGMNFDPEISYDGSTVLFTSTDPALVTGDNNGVADVFAYDVGTQAIARVSQNPNGGESLVASGNPQVNINGTRWAYQQGSGIVVHRQEFPGMRIDTVPDATLTDLSGNGLTVLYKHDGKLFTVYPWYGGGDPTEVVVGFDGPISSGDLIHGGSIDLSGNFAAFSSDVTNLVPDDNNEVEDSFIAPVAGGVEA